jgi:hypothetical protein
LDGKGQEAQPPRHQDKGSAAWLENQLFDSIVWLIGDYGIHEGTIKFYNFVVVSNYKTNYT